MKTKKQNELTLALPEYCHNMNQQQRECFQEVLDEQGKAKLALDNKSVTFHSSDYLDVECLECDDFYTSCYDIVGVAMAEALIGDIKIEYPDQKTK